VDDKSLQEYAIPFDATITVSKISKAIALSPRWNLVMSPLELEHYSFLLKKVVRMFRGDKEPQDDVPLFII
jgi:hypothetical protein